VRELQKWVSIGQVIGAHGIKGELKVYPLTDNPKRYDLLESVWIFSSQSACGNFFIEKVRYLKNKIILKLKGIDCRTEAENLKGVELKIKREQCLTLPIDHYYYFDLIGLFVKSTEGVPIGRLVDILEMPANDVYIVASEEKEFLIPAIKQIIKAVDLKNGTMTIELLDGLLD